MTIGSQRFPSLKRERRVSRPYNREPRKFANSIYYYEEPIGYPDLRNTVTFLRDAKATQAVIDAINDGVSIVQHRDHGFVGGWGDPYFSTSHVARLINGFKLPVVFSINCASGAFDSNTGDCFCEAMLKKSNGGAVGIVGATKNSYSGYNDELAKGMYDAIWQNFYTEYPDTGSVNEVDSPTYHLGAILNYGKFAMYDRYVAAYYTPAGRPQPYPWGVSDSTTLLEFEIFHLLGDPELPFITAEPKPLSVSYDPDPVIVGQSSIDVTVNSEGFSLQGALVCVMKEGEVYAVAETNPVGMAHVVMDPPPATPGTMEVTVTRHDYIPNEGKCDVVAGQIPNLVYSSHSIDDSAGNGDHKANPGETIIMPVTLENVGNSDASSVEGSVSASSYVTFINDQALFPDIAAGGLGESYSPYFKFIVDSNVPNGTVVTFILNWRTADQVSGQTSFHVPIILPYLVDYTL